MRVRVFGKAGDFYRLRVLKLNEESSPELDWHDDILFKKPPVEEVRCYEWYVLQAVSIDSEEAHPIRRFEDSSEAMRGRDKVDEFLRELTKQEFESRFLKR